MTLAREWDVTLQIEASIVRGYIDRLHSYPDKSAQPLQVYTSQCN